MKRWCIVKRITYLTKEVKPKKILLDVVVRRCVSKKVKVPNQSIFPKLKNHLQGASMNTSSGNAPNQVISDFLFAAIENNSENIMFTETKVGITFALYGLITYALVEARDIIIGTIRTISQYGPCCKYMCFVFLLVTFSCMLVSTYYLLRTIKPRHYPILGDTDISEEQKRLWSVGWNKDKTGLEMTYNVYYGNLVVQDEIGFIKCAAYELLRRNLIRILKRRYFDNAMWFFGGFVLSILVVGIATVIVTVWTE